MFRTSSVPGSFARLTLAVVTLGATMSLGAQEPPSSAGEAEARRAFMASPAWRDTMEALDEWFSVQIIYDKPQVAQLKDELNEKTARMSIPQLQEYLADLQQRLAVLHSKEALETRIWAEEYLNALAKPRAEEFRKSFPDVAHMTAAEMQKALADVQKQRAAARSSQQAFNKVRDQQVAMFQQMQRETAQANARAASRMNSVSSPSPNAYRSAYSPRQSLKGGYQGGSRGRTFWGYGFRW